jgi:hypothetical protein
LEDAKFTETVVKMFADYEDKCADIENQMRNLTYRDICSNFYGQNHPDKLHRGKFIYE